MYTILHTMFRSLKCKRIFCDCDSSPGYRGENFLDCENRHCDNPSLLAAGFRCAAGADNFCSVPLESSVQGCVYNYSQRVLSLLSEIEMDLTEFVCQFPNF